VPKSHIPSVVYWFVLLFIFTIPFEAADLSWTSSSFSLSKLSGLLFFMLYFLHYNLLPAEPLSQRPTLPFPSRAFWWFLGYVTIYALHGFLLPAAFVPGFFSRLFTLLQLLVFFWIASSLLKEEKVARSVLFTYVVASASLAIGLALRLPGFSVSFQAAGVERVTALEYNPNVLATLWALAMVVLIGLCFNPTYKRLTRLLLGILATPLLIGIVSTGSRVGTGALIIGLLMYLLPYRRSKQKWAAIILAILGIAATVHLIVHSPSTMQRWEGALSKGQLSGREEIVPAAIEMISERPFLGWQPARFQAELARRMYNTPYFADSKDAHNLFLHLLMEVGVVGTVPFCVGLWLCGHASWKARSRYLGMLPLALFCTVLAASMTQTALARKPFWLVLALAFAAASMTTAGQAHSGRRLLIRRPSGNTL
jgi:O-antigen ligase